MGKVIKYCAACEESFAEKFVFCPNCGAGLSSFEMKPVETPPVKAEDPVELEVPEAPAIIAAPRNESVDMAKTQPVVLSPLAESFDAPGVTKVEARQSEVHQEFVPADSHAAADSVAAKERVEPEVKAAPPIPKRDPIPVGLHQVQSGEGFNPTIVEESAGPIKRMLLLGAFLLVMTGTFSAVVYDLFNSNPFVGALDENELISFVPPLDPEQVEIEEPEQKKNKDDGGGGGGGGKDRQEETSKGQLASQSRNPIMAPSVTMDRVTNPEIKVKMETEGDIKRKTTDEKYGNPTSINLNPSDGTGTGGGQGSGVGRGQGSGIGTGQGSGIGSGSGSGNGNGNGSGTGDGDGADAPPRATPKPTPQGVTEGMKILSKPRPSYTDDARKNSIQGVVTLRVTFLASGQIGSISPVSGLPYGLTDQAIAAARQIRFEPAKRNGVPQTVVKTVQFNFAMY